jgi:hypothetical protein
MSNQLYNKGRELHATGGVNWTTSDIRMCLVYSSYTFDATHEFLTSILPAERCAVGVIANRTATDGYCDGDEVPFVGLDCTTDNVAYIVFYLHTGDDATSSLLVYYDVVGGFPLVQDGDYTIFPDLAFGPTGAYFRI